MPPQMTVIPFVLMAMGPACKSAAITVKLFESLRLGLPLSVTTTVIKFVKAPAGPEGVQENEPLVGLIAAAGGAFVPKLKVNCCAGISVSIAVNVSCSRRPFKTVRLLTAPRLGGVLGASESGLAGL